MKQLLNIHGKVTWRDITPEHEVSGIFFDSRKVTEDSVYVAIKGHSGDGHKYIPDVVNKGVVALVVEDISLVPDFFKGTIVEVLDSRIALQILSQNFYDSSGNLLKSIAVTGTNGKTSFSYILENLMNSLGMPCGVMGTIDHHLGDKKWDTQLTTPDPVTLQERLRDFVDLKAQAFVIEASSHALKQNRIHQNFDVCVFTNLTRDHMDYHPTEEDYFLSKAKLFFESMVDSGKSSWAIINGDDEQGERLSVLSRWRENFLYGKSSHCDFRFKIQEESLQRTLFQLQLPDKTLIEVESPLLGEHNVYNLVAGAATIYALGLNVEKSLEAFKNFQGIPGRLQLYRGPQNINGFVDYAHTDDALRKVLNHLSKLKGDQGGRILTVFGCGGDRDTTKRKFMGQVAKDLSDMIFVTSDNPRTEDPQKIIDDICVNFDLPDSQIIVENDRSLAIQKAVEEARQGDIILVAGKGHEDYQILGDKTIHFSDYEQLKNALSSK